MLMLPLTKSQFEVLPKLFMPYVLGKHANQDGLSWHEARVAYVIANINDNHWVCVEISPEDIKN